FESMTYTHRVQNAERIEYHYTARKKPDECPHCGCYDLAPVGTRLASYRYDVEDGLPVFLSVKKSQFCCTGCGRRLPAVMTVRMASARTTYHFWEMVVNSGMNLSDTA